MPGNAPTEILVNGGLISEAAASGAVVATLTTEDADPGDSFTYVITSDPSGYFAISGDTIRVAPGAVLDYETFSTVVITVQVTDSFGNTYAEPVTLQLLDANEITGTINNDQGATQLNGTLGNDIIDALAGNDVVLGDAGDDLIYGREGADNLQGGFGADTIYGGTENDTINVESGADTLYGEAGDDNLQSGGGGGTMAATATTRFMPAAALAATPRR